MGIQTNIDINVLKIFLSGNRSSVFLDSKANRKKSNRHKEKK